MTTTDAALGYWQTRHETFGPAWMAHYWDDVTAPFRQEILRAFRDIPESPSSILEVGCHAGPNLRLLHAAYPDAELWGIDANRPAFAYGRAAARREGWPIYWGGVDDVRHLSRLPHDTYDVVFSSYALCYIDPDEIDHVIAAMWALARVAVIIAEPMGWTRTHGISEQIERAEPPTWRHDYWSILWAIADADPRITRYPGVPAITSFPVDPPHQDLNGVLLLHKGVFRMNDGHSVRTYALGDARG